MYVQCLEIKQHMFLWENLLTNMARSIFANKLSFVKLTVNKLHKIVDHFSHEKVT